MGIEEGTSSGSSLVVARDALLALFSPSAFAWSASLTIVESVARVRAEGGLRCVDPMSSGANAPLIV